MKSLTKPGDNSGMVRAAALFLPFVLVSGLNGQSTEFLGNVTDQRGGGVPAALVTLTSVETGRMRSTQTDPEGRYLLVSVLPGLYDISAARQGFQKAVQRGIRV